MKIIRQLFFLLESSYYSLSTNQLKQSRFNCPYIESGHKTEIFFDEVLNGNNLVLEVYYEDLVKDLSVDFSNDNNIELQKEIKTNLEAMKTNNAIWN